MKNKRSINPCRQLLRAMFVVATFFLLTVAPLSVYAQHNHHTAKETSVVTENDEPEFTVRGQYIYITTSRVLNIRLYTILGQLITQQTVQPGTTRIKAPAKGVYILKAGSLTRRITINT